MNYGRNAFVDVGDRRVDGLRIDFRARLGEESTPNEATIQIWGLADDTIGHFQAPGAVIRLSAGYDTPRQIIAGTVVPDGLRVGRDRPERVLGIQIQDGGSDLADGFASFSFATQTSLEQVFAEAETALGLPRGRVDLPTGIRYPNGLAYSGSARRLLDELATTAGRVWNVRDGALFFYDPAGGTGEEATEVSTELGNLVGSPVAKPEGDVEITTLLDPSIRPGRKILLDSLDRKGVYVVRSVEFVGSNGWGQPFYAVATGRPA